MTRIFRLQVVLAWVGLLALSGCVERYVPAVASTSGNYLVVNGFINSQGVTTIQLTRSLALTDTGLPTPESRASVAIQSAGGQRFALAESPAGSGLYTSASLNLNPTLTYQLRLTTSTGREYASDLSPVRVAPPIDQVYWRYERDGVQLYADAHDPAGNTIYYRWKYAQTWQFTSAYQSRYQFNSNTQQIELRREDIYHCWQTTTTSPIVQTSTARLSQDVAKDVPLVFLAANAAELRFKYSILVQLLAQTKEEYDYWEALKKNTESLGSINDPLPTQLTGNVHCLSDNSEPTLGFVGVHSVNERRIFISNLDVPQLRNVRSLTGYEDCTTTIQEDRCPPRQGCNPPGVTYVFDTPVYLPYATNCDTSKCNYLTARYYYGAKAACVDCRLRGTNVQPSFWK